MNICGEAAMETEGELVIVDADAIVATALRADVNHTKAMKVVETIDRRGVELLYPVTAVVEAVTVIQRVYGDGSLAKEIARVFRGDNRVVNVGEDIYEMAVNEYFEYVKSKKKTLFDCLVAAVAKKYGVKTIFSFDRFYQKVGYELVEG
jgi:predicted nucleic acid-binding protein